VNTNTLCVFDGPSLLDGVRTVVLVSGYDTPSINTKTGDMLQSYILRADMAPSEAAAIGADETICGQCAMRPLIVKAARLRGGTNIPCYVDKVRGPDGVWKSWAAGNVEYVTPSEAAARYAKLRRCPGPCDKGCKLVHTHMAWLDPITPWQKSGHGRKRCASIDHATTPLGFRDGAYGDPATIDAAIWRALHLSGRKRTSYTHQWETSPELADMAMASIDSQTWPDVDAAIAKAKALGFRWYRILRQGETPRKDERMCPEASTDGAISCADCGVCDGSADRNGKARRLLGITIPAIN
jgi:hypothetical protein